MSETGVIMSEEKIAALIAAGRLLQSKQWPGGKREIKREHGESYPQAVLRVIRTLDESEREKLRELTEWVRDYERADECWLGAHGGCRRHTNTPQS